MARKWAINGSEKGGEAVKIGFETKTCRALSTLHLAPHFIGGGVAASSVSSNQSGEGEVRRSLIEANLGDCMVALPGQLSYSRPFGKS